MSKAASITILLSGLALAIAGFTAGFASVQQDSDNVSQTIDQLVEQNRQLEKQNQGLTDQINSLRRSLVKRLAPAKRAAVLPNLHPRRRMKFRRHSSRADSGQGAFVLAGVTALRRPS